MSKYFSLVVVILFIVLSVIFYMLQTYAPAYDFRLLMGANIIMALLSFITYQIVKRQVNTNPQAFVRGVYASTFLKLMVCIVGIMVYVMINRPNIHKPSLFVLFGIYAVYTFFETISVSKLARGGK